VPPETAPPRSPVPSLAATAGGHVLGWAIVATAYTVAVVVGADRDGRPVVPLEAWLKNLSFWALWPPFTFAVDLALRRPAVRRRRVLVLPLALCVVVFLLVQGAANFMLSAHYEGKPAPSVGQALAGIHPFYVFLDGMLMVGAIACVYALHLLRERLALERAHAQAQAEALSLRLALERQRLSRLQAQLEPHFMFNALNAISALVRGGDAGAALTAIARLSDLMRHAVRGSREEWSTFGEELAFVEGYLALQQLRFGERLQVALEVDPDLAHRPCPALLLQPLVENAVTHGIEPLREPGRVALVARAVDGGVRVRITNPLPPGAGAPGLGVGLSSVRERLAAIWRGRAQLRAEAVDGRFEVELLLPEPPDD
jgi:two-component system sensor histidine kinase AlgZ